MKVKKKAKKVKRCIECNCKLPKGWGAYYCVPCIDAIE